MYPYTKDENARSDDATLQSSESDLGWLTAEMVEFHIRRGEQLRAEVMAAAFARAGRWCAKLARAAWHAATNPLRPGHYKLR